jgi:hypothetical protein
MAHFSTCTRRLPVNLPMPGTAPVDSAKCKTRSRRQGFYNSRHHGALDAVAEHLDPIAPAAVPKEISLWDFAAVLHPKTLSHGDLNSVDMDAVPDRFEHGIRKSRIKVCSAPAPCRVVIEPEDVFFWEKAVQNTVELGADSLLRPKGFSIYLSVQRCVFRCRYCSASPCCVMSRPSISFCALTRRGTTNEIAFSKIKVTIPDQVRVAAMA